MSRWTKQFTQCLKFGQLSVTGLLLCSFANDCLAFEANILSAFNPRYKVQQRNPSSYAPNVEISSTPVRTTKWYEKVLVEDDAGVMRGMRATYDSWEKTNEYAKNWNLDTTGLYHLTDQADRRALFNRKIIRYFDKRLSGEVKKAEKGSTLARVGQLQKTLKPQTNVSISRNYKLKVKARVLQGKTFMYLRNPFFDNQLTVSLTGKVNLDVSKNFKNTGYKVGSNYDVNEGRWIAHADKQITNHLKARISSQQDIDDLLLSGPADKRLEFMFSQGF